MGAGRGERRQLEATRLGGGLDELRVLAGKGEPEPRRVLARFDDGPASLGLGGAPLSPSVTPRSASGSATIVNTTSAPAAASRGEAATGAPSASAFSRVRFQTVSSWPAARRRAAMREPIAPRPIHATSVIP
jgi:hypothetical protein